MNLWPLFLAGITDSYNPCSIGVLLISLTILFSLGRKKLIALFGLSYLATIFTTYFLIGLGLLRAFHLFGIHGFFGYAAGVILIVAGLIHLAPGPIRNLPGIRWILGCHLPKNIEKHLENSVFISGIILGFLIGLCTVPCAGGIYLGAIGLLASRVSYWRGVLGIFIFNLGFILPLLAIFLVASRKSVLEKLQKLNVKLSSYSHYIIPIIMILMGIILILIAKK
ncbi:MAG TPA: cytochrome c biogenesis protein CcdA [Patescibacteria group bacterium]|nr:cytochrome c biogenesis protein CcdA [Patescibacteria group bacterium]